MPVHAGLKNVHARVLPITEPDSPYLVAYRRLYRKILYLKKQSGIRTIGISSSDASEGKTLSSVNLALTIAEDSTQRVALLDCDFRKPLVSEYLGIPAEPGLVDVVNGDKRLEEVLVPVGREGRMVQAFAAGRLEAEPTPSFFSNQLAPALEVVKGLFDIVIVDTPPILPVSDVEFLADFLDAVILVVRAGKTPRDLVAKAIECMEGKNLIGILLNGVEKPISGGGYYGYYYKAYGRPDQTRA